MTPPENAATAASAPAVPAPDAADQDNAASSPTGSGGYTLGTSRAERARLARQGVDLAAWSATLLERVGVSVGGG